MITLSGSTRVVGLFGDPVAHSLSPLMQNAALRAAAIDAVYVPFHVTPEQLCAALEAVRALDLVGVNLTIPHKEAACALVDELDPAAALIGAVNTVVAREGRLIGYNTDGLGLLSALRRELAADLDGKRVLVVGAGGASRAAVVALAQAGVAWIGVANRTPERAATMLGELSAILQGTAFAPLPLAADLPGRLGAPVDLLVNSTAVGLHGELFGFPLESCVRPGGAVYDMTYGKGPTRLVLSARAAGLVAADGRGMLAGQGEEAFRLWFGVSAPDGVMRSALDAAGDENQI